MNDVKRLAPQEARSTPKHFKIPPKEIKVSEKTQVRLRDPQVLIFEDACLDAMGAVMEVGTQDSDSVHI